MSPGTHTLYSCPPVTHEEFEDDAAVRVDVLEGDSPRLLEAHSIHEGGRALIRVGGHVVPQWHPR